MISILLNFLRLVLWLSICSILENFHLHFKRMCILLLLNWMFQIDTYCLTLLALMCYGLDFLIYFLSVWSVQWWKCGVKNFLLLLCYCQFLPLCLLIFDLGIYVLCVGNIHIYNSYIFLNWFFYHSVMSFLCLLLQSFPIFKVYFVRYKYLSSSFLFISIHMEYFFPYLLSTSARF